MSKHKPRKATCTDVVIGARLRKFRKLRGMTQTDLAKPLGITFQQLQKYERGTNRLPATRLRDVSALLQVSPLCILYGISIEEYDNIIDGAERWADELETEIAPFSERVGDSDSAESQYECAKGITGALKILECFMRPQSIPDDR